MLTPDAQASSRLEDLVKAKFTPDMGKDCVSDLAIAASMADPKNVFDADETYEHSRGWACMNSVLKKYFSDAEEKRDRAVAQLVEFREQKVGTWYGTPKPERQYSANTAEMFRGIAKASVEGAELPEVARKLVCGFAGQGKSEHANKDSALTYTKG